MVTAEADYRAVVEVETGGSSCSGSISSGVFRFKVRGKSLAQIETAVWKHLQHANHHDLVGNGQAHGASLALTVWNGQDHVPFAPFVGSENQVVKHHHDNQQERILPFGLKMRLRVSPVQDEEAVLALPGRYFSFSGTYTVPITDKATSVVLRLDQDDQHEQQGTAGTVWDGALLLADALVQHHREALRDSRVVVELGAGCGLVGLTAASLGARHVVLTDLPLALPRLQANIEQNRHAFVNANVECRALDWYDETVMADDKDCLRNADLIFVADCVWMRELVDPLMQTLRRLTTPLKNTEDRDHNPLVLISYQQRGKATDEAFWKGLESGFGRIERLTLPNMPSVFSLLSCRRC